MSSKPQKHQELPLHVPDRQQLGLVEKLCLLEQPYHLTDSQKEHDKLFLEAMREVLIWHERHSSFFRSLLQMNKFHPQKLHSSEDLQSIPWVLAQFFKHHEILSVPREQVALHLTSSGTTGQKSQIFFDDWSIRSAQRMVDLIFRYYGWDNPETPTSYLLYTYEPSPESKLGTAYTDHYLCKFAPVQNVFYALRNLGGRHQFDSFGCVRALQEYAEHGIPVRIFGFPAFFYFTLQRMRELGVKPLKLHPESLVFLGGGWKGHADQQISKPELYSLATECLGIPNERLRDGFGSVEHCIPYIECRFHQFHVPVWSKVYVRDVQTLKPLPYGEKGFLTFMSPYITSVPANHVIMGDLATLHSGQECPCEIQDPFFIVHGRAGTSKSRSCAVAASELLKEEAR